MQRLATLASVVACALVAAVSAQADINVRPAALTEVQVPRTTPMSAAAVNLASFGYTEREFYAAGTAHRYRGASTSSLRTAEVIDDGWRYRTRVLVRSPRPGHFNGTL